MKIEKEYVLREMINEYDVEEKVVRNDIEEFVEKLTDAGVL